MNTVNANHVGVDGNLTEGTVKDFKAQEQSQVICSHEKGVRWGMGS